jgi:sulfatase maturation enzyme AslB (radical SAM superfamily)
MPEGFPSQPEILPEQAFTEFVFKLASRCNMQPPSEAEAGLRQLPILAQGGVIGCDQCYEYVGNTSWKDQPPIMSPDVIRTAAFRIAEHAEANELEDIRIVGHGGEFLMASEEYLDTFATTVRKTVEAVGSKVHFSAQTNGLLLTKSKLSVLQEHRFNIGLSLDGDRRANDLHRRDRLGRSTYDRVVEAAQMLDYYHAKWGILTVIDTANNPEETLESLAALKPHTIKMHPPHSNWTSLPKPAHTMSLGEWQVRVFERYRQWGKFHPGQDVPPFALYPATDYIDSLLGALPTDERVANRYPHELFFLPNGDIQRLDTLKTTEAGAYQTSFNVFEHSLNEVAKTDPGFIARRIGKASLAEECQSCSLLEVCGGDYYPLRFKQTEQPLDEKSKPADFVEAFKNPSIYCADQKRYLGHLAAFVKTQKELAAKIPVNIHKVWIGSDQCRERERNNFYTMGSSSTIDATMYPNNVQFLMGKYDTGTGRNRFGAKHVLDSYPAVPEIPPEVAEKMTQLIKTGAYDGTGAILALEKLAAREHPDKVLYFQPDLSRRPSASRFRTVEDLYNNKNHAIVRALFNSDQFILDGCEYACLRSGPYWVVTKNAVEVHARSIGLPATAFVSVLPLPKNYVNNLISNRPTFETENFLAGLRPYKTPVGVKLSDAPPSLLVVDVPGAPPKEVIAAAKSVAAMIPQYDHPEQVSVLLEQQDSPITFVPITGKWWSLRSATYAASGAR